jgi:hypothetical protein
LIGIKRQPGKYGRNKNIHLCPVFVKPEKEIRAYEFKKEKKRCFKRKPDKIKVPVRS